MSDLHRWVHVILKWSFFKDVGILLLKFGVLWMIFGKWIDRQAGFSRRCAGHLWIVGVLALQSSCEWVNPPTVLLTAEEFRFIPTRIEWSPDSPLRLLIRNQGRERHVFHSPELFGPSAAVIWHQPRIEFQEANAIVLEPGQSVELSLSLSSGLYPYRCWIKGHTGMEGMIIVKDFPSA